MPTARIENTDPFIDTEPTGDDMTITDTHEPPRSPDAASRPIYRLVGVTRTYPQRGRVVTALAGVDVEIAEGDFVAIQGPTGGGKSTLLQLLGALDKPSSGSVVLGGTDIATVSQAELGRLRAEEIGFVFQGFNLIPTLTAHENVDMALEPLGSATKARSRAARVGRGPRPRRPGRSCGSPAGRALGRSAAARRDRPRDRQAPAGASRG